MNVYMKKPALFISAGMCFCLLTLFCSCRKLIDIPESTVGQITTSQVFGDSVSAINGVVGIYASNLSVFSPLSGYMTLYPGLTADELASSSSFYTEYLYNALTSTHATDAGGSSTPLWGGWYRNTLLYAVNAAIEGLKASATLSSTLKDQLIGECEVIRALAYFNLVNLFGGVPKVTTSNFLVNNRLARSPVDTIYALIRSDLSDAVIRLSSLDPAVVKARPNSLTAMALLSRVCLYREQWWQADSLASAVINSGVYRLSPDAGDVFQSASVEAVWQAPGVTFDGVTLEGNIFIPYSTTIIPPLYLTNSLLNTFEPGDQRRLQWTHAVTVNGATYTYPFKYRNSSTVFYGGDESYIIFRLAEEYLIRAEARAHLGKLTDAAADVDVIRTRAGLSTVTYSDGDDLLRKIQHERRIELFCEWGHRWFDLKRWGTIDAVLTAEKGSAWPADGHGALYPIPGDQIALNPLLEQNPGY
jgi:hypothetical protein